jgi:serine/threonine protein phosphatase 1
VNEIAVIGDVHGNSVALRGLLWLLNDWHGTLIFAGDFVNRGPDSSGVLDVLVGLARDRSNTVFLKGNHDMVLLDAIQSGSVSQLLRMGGAPTIKSYIEAPGVDVANQFRESFPVEHLAFLSSLQPSYKSADGLVVTHGPDDELPDLDHVRYHIYGHVPTDDFLPRIDSDSAGIDTGCGTFRSGRLTCLFWPSLASIQVDKFGRRIIL